MTTLQLTSSFSVVLGLSLNVGNVLGRCHLNRVVVLPRYLNVIVNAQIMTIVLENEIAIGS